MKQLAADFSAGSVHDPHQGRYSARRSRKSGVYVVWDARLKRPSGEATMNRTQAVELAALMNDFDRQNRGQPGVIPMKPRAPQADQVRDPGAKGFTTYEHAAAVELARRAKIAPDVVKDPGRGKSRRTGRYSKKAAKVIAKKIRLLRREGYGEVQAVAIALDYARKRGLKVPGR